MPCSTKFMMGCVVCCLAGLSIAAGAAISHQAGACNVEVIDNTDWATTAVGVRGLRFVCEYHPCSHQTNNFPVTVGYGRSFR